MRYWPVITPFESLTYILPKPTAPLPVRTLMVSVCVEVRSLPILKLSSVVPSGAFRLPKVYWLYSLTLGAELARSNTELLKKL